MSAFGAAAPSNEENITVLINVCYGDWTPSELAMELYNNRRAELCAKVPALQYVPVKYTYQIARHDQIMVDVWRELGDEFDKESKDCNGCMQRISDTHGVEINKKYADCYVISEYDGNESLTINYDKYYRNCVTQILANEALTDAAKIAAIRDICANNLADPETMLRPTEGWASHSFRNHYS